MNTTRRTVLKAGLVIAATTHTAVASGDDTASALTKLIERHKSALVVDREAWNVVADITEALETKGHETPRVQIGVYHVMDGTKPMFARTEDEVRAHFKKTLEAQLSLFHPNLTAGREAVSQRYAKSRDTKLDELKQLQDAYQRREDESGLTQAMGNARSIMATVRAIEGEIVSYVPASFEEAIQKASWCAWAMKDDYCYLNDSDHPEDVLVEALAAIGRAIT